MLASQEIPSLPPVVREYVTLREAATITAFSYDFVYDAIQRGELTAIKKGRAYRIGLADLHAWMGRDRVGGKTPSRSEAADLIRRHLPGLR